MKKILLIENDKPLSNGICLAIKTNEFSVVQCFNLRSAKEQYSQIHFDLRFLEHG